MSQSCLSSKFCGNRTFSPDAADISAHSCVFILFGVWTFLFPITHSSCLHVHFKKKIQSMMVWLCCFLSCRLGIRGVGEGSHYSRMPGKGARDRLNGQTWTFVSAITAYVQCCYVTQWKNGEGIRIDRFKGWGQLLRGAQSCKHTYLTVKQAPGGPMQTLLDLCPLWVWSAEAKIAKIVSVSVIFMCSS